MAKVSLNLPTTTTVALGKDTTDRLPIEWARVKPNVLEAILVAGAKVIITNAYNGGGKDAKQVDKVSAATKKLDAWYRGEFNVVTRGDTMMTALREAYVDDVKAKTGATTKQVEDSIRAAVSNVFGEKEAATFGRFIDAMGTLIARQKHGDKPTDEAVQAEREAFEARYQALADEAAKRRADASKTLDLTGLMLGDFLKPSDD
jgi:hypothetical protein